MRAVESAGNISVSLFKAPVRVCTDADACQKHRQQQQQLLVSRPAVGLPGFTPRGWGSAGGHAALRISNIDYGSAQTKPCSPAE